MQVTFEKVGSREQEGAVIRAVEETEAIRNAIALLEGNNDTIPVTRDGQTFLVKLSAIYYIESVDKKTFVYTKENCYETKLRLYELEETLGHFFARISKAVILNLKKVDHVKSELGGRMDAYLLNGEVQVISRSYVKEIKRRLEIG